MTKPGFPQVELEAQSMTVLAQSLGNVPARIAAFVAADTHETYWPWFFAPAQSHCARTAAAAAGSLHTAKAGEVAPRSATTGRTRMMNFMATPSRRLSRSRL